MLGFSGFGQIVTGRNPNSDFYAIRVAIRKLEFVSVYKKLGIGLYS